MVDVEKMRALLAAATPGPWGRNVWYGSDDGGWAAVGPHMRNTEDEGDDESPDCPAFDRANADAAFIAAARDTVPELLDEVELLRSEVVSLRDMVESGDIEEPWRREVERLRKDWDNALSAAQATDRIVIQKLTAEVEQLRARTASLCDCALVARAGCPDCGGTGAVMVEGRK